MTEIAQTYLGNIDRDRNLAELIAKQDYLEVSLEQSDRSKGRIHTRTSLGVAIGIIKSRDRLLESGDLFETDSQKLLLIRLQASKLLVLDFANIHKNLIPTKLVYLGHVLGNHHYPIAVRDYKIYVELTAEDRAIEQTIKDLQIPDLEISYEIQQQNREITFSSHSH